MLLEPIRYCRILVESFLFGENFGVIFQFLSSRRHGHFEGRRVCYEQFVLQPELQIQPKTFSGLVEFLVVAPKTFSGLVVF